MQEAFRVELAENLDKQGDNTGPTRLVAGPDAGAIVPVEVLVEQKVIPPVGIRLFIILPEPVGHSILKLSP